MRPSLPATLLLCLTACQPPPAPGELEFDTANTTLNATGEPIYDAALLPLVEGGLECHSPTITGLPDGTMLAAWYSYPTAGLELSGSAIYMARRDAQGWSAPFLHRDSPMGDANPVLYSEGGKVWLFQAVVPGGWSTAHVEFQISQDEGASWSDPQVVPGPLATNVRFPPLRLLSGKLLLPAYDDLWQRSQFFLGEDRWTQISVLSTGLVGQNIQPSVAQLSDGRLLTVMRDTGGKALWVSCSDDEGFSWTAPQQSNFPNPGSPAQILNLRSGNLLLVFNNDPVDRVRLSAALSPDEGKSWTTPTLLVEEEGAIAYPSAVQTDDGLIHMVYSRDRTAIGYARFNEAWLCRAQPVAD